VAGDAGLPRAGGGHVQRPADKYVSRILLGRHRI